MFPHNLIAILTYEHSQEHIFLCVKIWDFDFPALFPGQVLASMKILWKFKSMWHSTKWKESSVLQIVTA